MPPEGFEPAVSASEMPQSHDLDCAAIGAGITFYLKAKNSRNRPGVAQRVPGVLGYQISKTFGT